MPVIGILAIAATACQGVGLTEARQAVDNQRAINDLEEREVRPIEREIENLYENEILPLERELEDLWNEINGYEHGEFHDAYNSMQDPWAPGGPAHELQQEFNDKYAEIDRLYRELEAESRRIQIEQQFTDHSFGIDPAVAALEDERFALQRRLDRLHQFGRRPIEDIYMQMNELNASNGWAQGDIYAADDLNRQIADIQNQLANAYSHGSQFNDQNQHELMMLDDELNYLRNEGYWPIQELYNRIGQLEHEIAVFSDGSVTGTTTDSDVQAQIDQLEAEMHAATEGLRAELEALHEQYDAAVNDAQAQIDALMADGSTTVEPVDTSAMQAEVDALVAQIADRQAATDATVADLNAQIADLDAQVGDIFAATDTTEAGLQAEIADLQAQIDALDSTTENYAEVVAGLEAQIEEREAAIAAAIASEAETVSDLQAQMAALEEQRAAEESAADVEIAALQSQIDALQAVMDAAGFATSTGVSQDVLDQVAALEAARDETLAGLQTQIDEVNDLIADTESQYLDQIAELQSSEPETAFVNATDQIGARQAEIQELSEHAAHMENEFNEKIRVLEERREQVMRSLNDHAGGGSDVAHLENELARLHDELNALHNSGFEASRNSQIRMEELQNEAVRLEKQLNLDIRALEDQLWELDGRIAELYRTGHDSSFDPHAEFNERMKEIELERFELDQRRWELDDEQHNAFDQFHNYGSEMQAEIDAKRAEVLDPLYARVDEIQDEMKALRDRQRELEDKLRDARRSVEEQIREIEDQTLDLIEEAVTSAEENAESLNGLEGSILDGIDTSALGETGSGDVPADEGVTTQ